MTIPDIPNGNVNQEQIFSTGQAARRLGVNVRTIYRWEKASLLHPIRLPNGQRRFFQREIDALLRKRRKDTPRCILYARVSSAKQAETGNLNRQKERLLEAAQMRGYEVVTAIPNKPLASMKNAGASGGSSVWRRRARRMWCWSNTRTGWPDLALPTSKKPWPLMVSGWKCWTARWPWTPRRNWSKTCWRLSRCSPHGCMGHDPRDSAEK
ncbi:MAG: MerR family DNA-binding transcriptional regulator [Actinomycetia bacterium]|nr:MerR family DNA-binding transcriptional regulator [Actinomycetes bacterium]